MLPIDCESDLTSQEENNVINAQEQMLAECRIVKELAIRSGILTDNKNGEELRKIGRNVYQKLRESFHKVKEVITQLGHDGELFRYIIAKKIVRKEFICHSPSLNEWIHECIETQLEAVDDPDIEDIATILLTIIEQQKNLNLSTRDENMRMIVRSLCKCCKSTRVSHICLPCRHISLCTHCVSNCHTCPQCDSSIDTTEIAIFVPETVDNQRDTVVNTANQILNITTRSEEIHYEERKTVPQLPQSSSSLINTRDGHENIEQLKRENVRLIVQSLCRQCEQRKATILCLPCGHVALCPVCSENNRICPVGGLPIQENIPIIYDDSTISLNEINDGPEHQLVSQILEEPKTS